MDNFASDAADANYPELFDMDVVTAFLGTLRCHPVPHALSKLGSAMLALNVFAPEKLFNIELWT